MQRYHSVKMPLLRGIFYLAILPFMALTLFSYLGRYGWTFELLTHFRVQYLVFACVLLLLAFQAAVHHAWKSIAVSLCGLHLLPLVLLDSGQVMARISDPLRAADIRIISANVRYSYLDFDRFETFVKAENADVLVLTEVTPISDALVDLLDQDYPYQEETTLNRSFGVLVMSKYPIDKPITHTPLYADLADLPIFEFEICPDTADKDRCFTTIAAHAPRPGPNGQLQSRNETLAFMASRAKQADDNRVVVLGDFNITPWSPYFNDFMTEGDLQHSHYDVLTTTTWISRFPLFGLSVDHILHGKGLQMLERRVGPDVGSDHFPVIADFAFQ